MQRWITLPQASLAQASLALVGCGLVAGASAAADGDVVVIRGASVSVAQPLVAERTLDGRSEVEIVRVEVEPEPAAKPAPREPEREIVVIVVPGEDPVPTWVGVPIAWRAPRAWGKWRGVPVPHPHRHEFRSARGRGFTPSSSAVGKRDRGRR